MQNTPECKNIHCKYTLTKLIWGTKLKGMYFKNQYIFWRVDFNPNVKNIGYGLTEKTENRICPQMTNTK